MYEFLRVGRILFVICITLQSKAVTATATNENNDILFVLGRNLLFDVISPFLFLILMLVFLPSITVSVIYAMFCVQKV